MEWNSGHTVKLVLMSRFCEFTAGGAFETFSWFPEKAQIVLEDNLVFNWLRAIPHGAVHYSTEQIRPEVDHELLLF